jgi:hypothetical protein
MTRGSYQLLYDALGNQEAMTKTTVETTSRKMAGEPPLYLQCHHDWQVAPCHTILWRGHKTMMTITPGHAPQDGIACKQARLRGGGRQCDGRGPKALGGPWVYAFIVCVSGPYAVYGNESSLRLHVMASCCGRSGVPDSLGLCLWSYLISKWLWSLRGSVPDSLRSTPLRMPNGDRWRLKPEGCTRQ